MRIFIAMLATETNTFAPFPTSKAGFEDFLGILRDGSTGRAKDGAMGVFRTRAEADGHEVIESISTFAQPSGRVVDTVYEELRDMIIADLRDAGPVDMILLALHGAMAAQSYDDCEGDILRRVRELAPRAVIGAELDPHCHLTREMVTKADCLILAKEYPHIDFNERAHELYDICSRCAAGEVRPVAALVDTRIVGFYPTFDAPMRDIVDALHEAEAQPGILSASIVHGFPWADVADVGTRVLVYGDGNGARAAAVAEDFAQQLFTLRHTLAPDLPTIAESLDRARQLDGHVVLADFADNPGGGAASDSTFMLHALIETAARDAVVGAIWDPIAVQTCADAGVGAELNLRFGGKAGPFSGQPVDARVTVVRIEEDYSSPGLTFPQRMGRTAWIHLAGIDVILSSIRAQVISPDLFTGLGISLHDKRLSVIKSQAHYQAAFRPICDHSWAFASPGTMNTDFANIAYSRRDRRYFPFVDDPWSLYGRPAADIHHAPSLTFSR